MFSTFTATRRACYTAYITQAVVNNLAPLLFIVFHTGFDIPVAQLGLLAALNFTVQLLTDLAVIKVIDRVGFRKPLIIAHILATIGLVLLAILPFVFDNAFAALAIAISVYAVGGGLLEVVVSPVVDALPQDEGDKAAGMALLHSFYCWGQLGVVVVSTATLALVGREYWPVLPVIWAMIPLANMFVFRRVPMPETVHEDDLIPVRKLLGTPMFMAALVLMMTGGAAELTIAQWSSFFAEQGTGVSKELGDLLGPGLFALLMGIGRFAYGMWGKGLPLKKVLVYSSLLASVCYVVAATSPIAVVSLLACALCGFAVSLLWPGTFSLTAAAFPMGGAAMFALLALAGDAGGASGPAVAGGLASSTEGWLAPLAEALPADSGSGLRAGLLLCAVIPLIFSFTVMKFGTKKTTVEQPA